MESRIVPRLFFCGEVLDIDGFTGGSTSRRVDHRAARAASAPEKSLLKG